MVSKGNDGILGANRKGQLSSTSSSSILDTTSSINTNNSITNLISPQKMNKGHQRKKLISNDHEFYNSTTSSSSNDNYNFHRRSLEDDDGKESDRLPLAIKILSKLSPWTLSATNRRTLHKSLILLITFIAYAAFHMGRRPLAVVKAELHHGCDSKQLNNTTTSTTPKPDHNNISNRTHDYQYVTHTIASDTTTTLMDEYNDSYCNDKNCTDWAPFDQDDKHANLLFGYLDSSFLASYAFGMFFSGFIAERMNLRHLLSVGCALSGLGLIAAGLARTLQIHSFSYFIIVQILSGIMQSTGWPVVVTCVGNWLGKSERGLIYGLWNSHTSLGNIVGSLVAGAFVRQDWGLSFIIPGFIMLVVALVCFLVVVPSPDDVPGMIEETNQYQQENDMFDHHTQKQVAQETEIREPSISCANDCAKSLSTIDSRSGADGVNGHQAVSFWRALCIPGVIEYSFCLFFSKSVSYTLLYWLPKYLAATRNMDSKQSALESVWFDIGGILGATVAGLCSDLFKTDGLICGFMFLAAIPAMFTFQNLSPSNATHLTDAILQALVGVFINGPYCLITTSVSVDLGDRIKDGRAMATVTAIIDGMGSLGAVIGPLLAGSLTELDDWRPVFMMLIMSNALAALCLSRIIWRELSSACSTSCRSKGIMNVNE